MEFLVQILVDFLSFFRSLVLLFVLQTVNVLPFCLSCFFQV